MRQKTGLGPSAEVLSFASPPDRRPKASTQRKGGPTICVPALRCGQTCVTPFELRCRPTRCAARRFAQTDGGKPVHDAALPCGSVARSPNRVPQAQTHGRVQATCKSCDEINLKRLSTSDSSYQKNLVSPLVPTLPAGVAAGTGQRSCVLCLLSWGRPSVTSKKARRLAGRDPPSDLGEERSIRSLARPSIPCTSARQYDLGKPSTFSAIKHMMSCGLTGARRGIHDSRI